MNAKSVNVFDSVCSESRNFPMIKGTVPFAIADKTPNTDKRIISFLYGERWPISRGIEAFNFFNF